MKTKILLLVSLLFVFCNSQAVKTNTRFCISNNNTTSDARTWPVRATFSLNSSGTKLSAFNQDGFSPNVEYAPASTNPYYKSDDQPNPFQDNTKEKQQQTACTPSFYAQAVDGRPGDIMASLTSPDLNLVRNYKIGFVDKLTGGGYMRLGFTNTMTSVIFCKIHDNNLSQCANPGIDNNYYIDQNGNNIIYITL